MPRKAKNGDSSKPVEAVVHKQDKRTNIPTRELQAFMKEDEEKPKLQRYPRDPSLDPQLVWQGKDDQDSRDLTVATVPIYIQEKIQPQAIMESLRDVSQKASGQMDLFSDFNGLAFDKLVEFYQHELHWTNRLILGDSLLVMNSLAEKEGLKGKVQMIYIDPPYGIKFGSNWQVSTRKRDVKDGKAEDATRQPEQIKAFRDTWQLGIHSYLSYLRDRLVVARELLTESGSVFMQIGDENVHLVRCLLDEVFGRENFVSQITFLKTSGQSSPTARTNVLASVSDYLIWYAKNISHVKYRRPFNDKAEKTVEEQYTWIQYADGAVQKLEEGIELDDATRLFMPADATSGTGAESIRFNFELNDVSYFPAGDRGWSTTVNGMNRLRLANRLIGIGKSLRFKRFLEDYPISPLANFWTDTIVSGYSDTKLYVVQTSTKVIERCLLMTTDPGDLVLDPTCGSGTTAYVAEQWGRRWITCDTSRVALALARTRIMAARYPYYLLSDSVEGIAKEAQLAKQLPPNPLPKSDGDIRKGFVYKRVPHVTLKAIANNEEIDVIHAKWQDKLESLRDKLNKLVKQQWQEWEIPREADARWSLTAKETLGQWWDTRRQRQHEMDDSIARRAETEMLYDQPYEDSKRIRVSGPFTVESLSPHRVLPVDDYPLTVREASRTPGQFENMILEHLKKAGVQNTVKNERMKFDSLESYPGVYLHGRGEYSDNTGQSCRVAVCIGPEHGTVGPELVKEAAKEAVKGLGFEFLIVCGFAFDPHVSEEARQYGKLNVLLTRMNPDLSMGNELLKNTGAGNLFMVFGEPDVEIEKQNGHIVVTIRGVDVYDPTTGAIRSHTTDDIACWFLDSDYNGESFFVRHAYFCGANEPYEKLKKALKAEIVEEAWTTLYTTKSRPFPVPQTGKIAVKVINHYGDEVLKVFTVK
jgi:adenine-specific DNA-methyltransferase